MRFYINNFKSKLLEELPRAKVGSALPLDPEALNLIRATLQTHAANYIRLTLSLAGDKDFELIDVVNRNGIITILRGAVEGSLSKSWAAGSKIICAPTSGSFRSGHNFTYYIKVQAAIDRSLMALRISKNDGRSQILNIQDLRDIGRAGDKTSIAVCDMADGDELLLEVRGVTDSNQLNFVNASRA